MKAWSNITEKFNLANIRKRDQKQLMNQRKKELSSYRRETSKTGGGPKPPSSSPDTMDVAEIPQQFEVDFNEFYCDGVEDITNKIIFETIDIPKENKAKNDKDYNPKVKENHVELNNKNPQTTPKKPTRKTPKASSSFSFGEASYQYIVKNMAEMHNQVMINLRLQTEILMKTLEPLNK